MGRQKNVKAYYIQGDAFLDIYIKARSNEWTWSKFEGEVRKKFDPINKERGYTKNVPSSVIEGKFNRISNRMTRQGVKMWRPKKPTSPSDYEYLAEKLRSA